ncbi:MAG TPA: APC family permease, partial [Streptosporangiaceae bacterium]|nr:APC family permease [Streptosporangiaceae bacterium]
LRTTDYFTLGFGTMVGVGWLVLMDDWLRRGGPAGVMLGFAIGGVALLPIALIYGRWVVAMPDAGSEIAYTASVFSPGASFAAGWVMMLAYLIVCPWEAVAIGRLASYIVPGLETWELFRIGGRPVYLPNLLLGLALTAAVTLLNHRGIRPSATFQKWLTFTLLGLFVAFALSAIGRGSIANLRPPFSHGGLLSVLLVVQIVPYFMTGFESIPKCAEEASPEFRSGGFFRAILLSLAVGVLFYVLVVAIVGYLRPWQPLATQRFATAVAFEQAFRDSRVVDLLLLAALLSLVKIFNGNFIAASRLLFALGRRGLVHPAFGRVHARHLTPSVAVLALGGVTALATCMGDAILVPVTEVGSMASALGWLATCAAYFRRRPEGRERALAVTGMVVAGSLVLMKLIPAVPGHFTRSEWMALLIWGGAGLAVRRTP